MKELKIKRIHAASDLAAVQVPECMEHEKIEWQKIDVVNWEAYPYVPDVKFRVAHTGDRLLIHYRVTEASVRAVAEHDDGRVWEDACCEFFVQPAEEGNYYNFECNCSGKLLLHGGAKGDRPSAPEQVLKQVQRWASLGTEPFEERIGECHWELALIIPVSTFFRHNIKDFSGKVMRANFYKCGDLLQTPHFLSWSPIQLPEPQFHCPEFFGKIEFEN